MRTILFPAILIVLWSTGTVVSQEPSAPTGYRLATFQEDITVPIGHRLMGILPRLAERISDPLQARGFVLLGSEQPIVVVSLDWCEIRNEAYARWRDVLAEAAGTSPLRVIVSCVHQHGAPVVDIGAQRRLIANGLSQGLCDLHWHEESLQRVARKLKASLTEARRVTHAGIGQAEVDAIASNRRIQLPDGRFDFSRGSSSGGESPMRNAPDGLIDPWLRTISFWDEEQPVLAWHTYATHPMSHYGDGEVSADFVGLARRFREEEQPGVFQVYMTGCAGDVTAGKYNDGSPENRPLLAARLQNAMREAWQNTRRWPLETIECRSTDLPLDFRKDDSMSESSLRTTLADKSAPEPARILAAMGLESLERVRAGIPTTLPCLDLGEAIFVLLPGEAFVGYALLAQRLRPDIAIICAGYGDAWTGYIPTDAAIADRFSGEWMWVAPGAQARIVQSLKNILRKPRELAPLQDPTPSGPGKACDVFVANQEHPRYSEGSILATNDIIMSFVATEFDQSTSDFAAARIVLRRSRDGGGTWDAPSILQDNVGRMNVMSATLRRFRSPVQSGLGLFYLVKNGVDDLHVYLRMFSNSHDALGEPIRITSEPGYHVMNNDRVTELLDGRLLCPVAWTRNVEQENHFVSFCYWSDDGGQSWTTGKSRVDLPARGAMEPEVIELDDGRILMIVRTQQGEIYASQSEDRGEHWTPAKPWGVPSPESPATLRRIPATGDLLLVWNPNYEPGSGHGGARTPLVASVSQDEGLSWGPRQILEADAAHAFSYVSATFAHEKLILSYYVDSAETKLISCRFRAVPLDWFYQPSEPAFR
jgi:BNR repeat-like domain